MIPINLRMIRWPTQRGVDQSYLAAKSWISPERIDTITALDASARKQQSLPNDVNSVVRYCDPINGFRLFYVVENADDIAAMDRRYRMGEDPEGYGGAMM